MSRLLFKWIGLRLQRAAPALGAFALAAAVFALFLCELSGYEARLLAQREELYGSFDIGCYISNATGTRTDALSLPARYVDSIESDLSELVRDIRVTKTFRYQVMEPGDPVDVEKPREAPSLIGINDISLSEELLSVGEIVWPEGVDDSFFANGGQGCIIPVSIAQKLMRDEDNKPYLNLALCDLAYRYGMECISVSLPIVTAYANSTGEDIYMSWEATRALSEQLMGIAAADTLTFSARDNRRLDELTQALEQYFKPVDPLAERDLADFAVTVQDSVFRSALSNVERNISVVKLLLPLAFVMSLACGFLISFLATRSRLREFAVMRSLGTSGTMVFLCAFGEQAVTAALGALLGMLADLLVRGALPGNAFVFTGAFVLLFLVGCAAASLRVARVNVIQMLSVKE